MAINIKTSLVILLGLTWISSVINASPVEELKTEVNPNAEAALPVKTKRDASPLDADFPLQLVNSKLMKSIRDLSALGLFDGALENIIGQVTHNIQKRGTRSHASRKFQNFQRKWGGRAKKLSTPWRRQKPKTQYNHDGSVDADDDISLRYHPSRAGSLESLGTDSTGGYNSGGYDSNSDADSIAGNSLDSSDYSSSFW
uniref:Uncharacterized protein n=1 Tax=Meteorus pulchricornis TaxID=51522 RepID=H7CHK3_9HYME|nr:hypothetical protein [Meteorus pulchricornis]